jgi:MFS family permease
LYLFYVWAPFYVPLYLHSELGLPWTTLGWVFAVMLLPDVILEYPAGWLADHYLGDKELLFAGFVIAGGSLAAIGTFTSQTPTWALLAILVLSRVGTALIEAMTEGHFYRRVSAEDINSMSLFRSVWPLSFVVGPVVASALLSITNFQTFLFVAGGFIAVAGVLTTLRIRDFR